MRLFNGPIGALVLITLGCAGLELQRRVDMAQLVEQLDDWSAVRLGALGPLRAGAGVLNRKRAAFLSTAMQEYGVARGPDSDRHHRGHRQGLPVRDWGARRGRLLPGWPRFT